MRTRLRQLWRAHLDLFAVASTLVAVVLTRLPTLANPLTEIQAFRQTQTAWTSLIFSQQGIDLLHPQVPVFGQPFALPLEFPLFQAFASVIIRAGLGPDLADRTLGLICFMIASVAVYRLGLRLSGRLVALVALLAFTFSPFGILYSRTSLIEFMATGASLWFLETSLAALESSGRRRWVLVVIAAALGGVAMTVKVTTGVFWLWPMILLLLICHKPSWLNWRYLATWAGLIGVPLALGLVWYELSRQVREQNSFAYALNDGIGLNWYFGTIAQRLDPAVWANIGARIWFEIGGALLPLLLVFAALEWRRIADLWRKVVWVGLALIVLAAPLVLINVYNIHDYYLSAIAPALALLIGLGASFLARYWSRSGTKIMTAVLMLSWLVAITVGLGIPGLVILGLSIPVIVLTDLYFHSRLFRPNADKGPWFFFSALLTALLTIFLTAVLMAAQLLTGKGGYIAPTYFPPPLSDTTGPAAQIEALVPPDHFVALLVTEPDPNNQWYPAYFYYAHREGLMIGSVVQSMGGLTMVCADPRYVLLSLSAQGVVSRAACPNGDPIP